MTLDFSGNGTMLDEVLILPDWNFPDVPKDSTSIRETMQIGGGSDYTSVIGGEIDAP